MATQRGTRQPSNASHTAGDFVDRVQVVDNAGNFGITASSSPAKVTASTTSTGVNVTTSSAQVLASNSSASGRLLINDSDTTIYLKAGTTAALNSGIRLNANGGAWDGLLGGALYTGRVDGIHGGTGNKVLLITEA